MLLSKVSNSLRIYTDPSSSTNASLVSEAKFSFKQQTVWPKKLKCYQIANPNDKGTNLDAEVALARCFVLGSMHQAIEFEVRLSNTCLTQMRNLKS